MVAPTTVEAVQATGGWMFDRAMAGWDVMVLVADTADSRPLHILGAYVGDLEAALRSQARGPQPHVLAVDAHLLDSDHRVRRLVVSLLERGLTEVRLWGEEWPQDIEGEVVSLHHQLSVAARAFKTQALAAAAAPVESLDTTEVFHSGELLPQPLGVTDLVPV